MFNTQLILTEDIPTRLLRRFYMEKKFSNKILLGNSFPMGLVKRPARLTPLGKEDLLALLKGREVVSFWGHQNTVSLVSDYLGREIPCRRVALGLSRDLYPSVDRETFQEVLLLTPEYRDGFRPQIGVEPTPEDIRAWGVLRVSFND